MSSTTGHYDQNLLAAAPVATKAQLQEGYTTDLLNPDHGKATPPPSASLADPERGLVNKEYVTTTRAPPFWQTRKGIIIIVVAVLVVLAVVIGGAVGGTRNSHKNPGSGIPTGTTNSTNSTIPSGTDSHPAGNHSSSIGTNSSNTTPFLPLA